MTRVPLDTLHAAVMSDDAQGLVGVVRHTVTFNLPPSAEILRTARPTTTPLLQRYLLIPSHPSWVL